MRWLVQKRTVPQQSDRALARLSCATSRSSLPRQRHSVCDLLHGLGMLTAWRQPLACPRPAVPSRRPHPQAPAQRTCLPHQGATCALPSTQGCAAQPTALRMHQSSRLQHRTWALPPNDAPARLSSISAAASTGVPSLQPTALPANPWFSGPRGLRTQQRAHSARAPALAAEAQGISATQGTAIRTNIWSRSLRVVLMRQHRAVSVHASAAAAAGQGDSVAGATAGVSAHTASEAGGFTQAQKNAALVAITLTTVINTLGASMLSPALPGIAFHFSAGQRELGVLYSTYAIAVYAPSLCPSSSHWCHWYRCHVVVVIIISNLSLELCQCRCCVCVCM